MLKRNRKRKRNRGYLFVRLLAAAGVWGLVAAPQAALVLAFLLYADAARDLPQIPDLASLETTTPSTNLILAADGTVLAEIPFVVGKEAGHRLWVQYHEMPRSLVQAIVAAEDVRFFSHSGIDTHGIARAALRNLRARGIVEGASTITQQLARLLEPAEIGNERTFRRKLREAILARRIERRYDKQHILTAWANQVFLGSGAYGVAAAARGYFSKRLAEIDLAESAMIAGLAQAPGRASPFLDRAAALARRNAVLERMERAGFIDAATLQRTVAEEAVLNPAPDRYGSIAPWIVESARREAVAVAAAAADRQGWARGGLVVETTVLPATTTIAEPIARRQSARIAKKAGTSPPQVAAFAFDHHTGYVETAVGGLDWRSSRFDRTAQACRQPGSAFKPILYAAALEHDTITPATMLRDAPISDYLPDEDRFWKPTNAGRQFQGAVLAQLALARSLNAPAIDVLDRVGTTAVVEMAQRLGISTSMAAVRPLALGASCVIPAELARAFTVFATGGKLVQPTVLSRIRSRETTILDRSSYLDPFLDPSRRLDRLAASVSSSASLEAGSIDSTATRVDALIDGGGGGGGGGTRDGESRALDQQTSFLVSSMLAEVVRSGTGRYALTARRPLAGKTGTSNRNADAWFVGYTGRLTLVVWVGHDDPGQGLGPRQDGSHAALPVWIEIVQTLEAGRPPVPIPGQPPPGVVRASIDCHTGLLAPPEASSSDRVDLYFRAGTEPTEQTGGLVGEQDLDRLSREF
ncbi:MAG: transglycosylase domain-containing protein [Pseudomonadota bacterium]